MHALLVHAHFLEVYGPRLDMAQLAEVLDITKTALLNRVAAGTLPVLTYVEGGKRWADARDAAKHFDDVRTQAGRALGAEQQR